MAETKRPVKEVFDKIDRTVKEASAEPALDCFFLPIPLILTR
jgi:hypothetical protein